MKNKIFLDAQSLNLHLSHNRPDCLVSTNGCFDILHVGHVNYLEASKKLGDALVVFVNSDDSVRRLNKAPNRPINHQSDRMTIISALECVDYVCLFDEDTPIESLKIIKPKIHTKGGDYSKDKLPETQVLHSWGGEVCIIPLTQGKSTTNLIQKLSKGNN